MEACLQIGLYGLSQMDRCFFKAMLDLANRKLEQHWQFVDKPGIPATVMLVDMESDQGREFCQNNAIQHKIIAFGQQPQDASAWFLPKPLKDVETLVALLSRIGSEHKTLAQTSPVPLVKPAYPANSFAACLDDIILHDETTKITVTGLPNLYIVPTHGRYYMRTVHSKAFSQTCQILCSTQRDVVVTEAISAAQLAQAVQDLHAYSLSTLIWSAALCAAQKQAPPSIDPRRPICLKDWPNFTRLPHQPEHVTLSAFFLRHHVSPEAAAETTHLALPMILAFCNACLAINLLHYQDPIASKATRKNISNETTRFFSRIMQRLMG